MGFSFTVSGQIYVEKTFRERVHVYIDFSDATGPVRFTIKTLIWLMELRRKTQDILNL